MLNTLCLATFAAAGGIGLAAIYLTVRDCAPALRRLFRSL